MSQLNPTPEALQALASSPDSGPVVMLNLLKFGGPGGRDAYLRYGAAVTPILAAIGARILYSGSAAELLIGDQTWDAVILVEYPSRQAFLRMISGPEYLAAHTERQRGLERTVLFATQPMASGR
jgi:uncharacterized protein (DUF1330 family)